MRTLNHYLSQFDTTETVGPNYLARTIYAAIHGSCDSASADELAPLMRKLPTRPSYPTERARILAASLLFKDAADTWTPTNHLQSIRQLLDLTQQAAAELVDVDRVTWARWESGASRPDNEYRKRFEHLADTLFASSSTSIDNLERYDS
jgi:hypothetical protein